MSAFAWKAAWKGEIRPLYADLHDIKKELLDAYALRYRLRQIEANEISKAMESGFLVLNKEPLIPIWKKLREIQRVINMLKARQIAMRSTVASLLQIRQSMRTYVALKQQYQAASTMHVIVETRDDEHP